MKKLLIMIPTYNEHNNIKKIISKFLTNFKLLFINDNYPDDIKKEIKNSCYKIINH